MGISPALRSRKARDSRETVCAGESSCSTPGAVTAETESTGERILSRVTGRRARSRPTGTGLRDLAPAADLRHRAPLNPIPSRNELVLEDHARALSE